MDSQDLQNPVKPQDDKISTSETSNSAPYVSSGVKPALDTVKIYPEAIGKRPDTLAQSDTKYKSSDSIASKVPAIKRYAIGLIVVAFLGGFANIQALQLVHRPSNIGEVVIIIYAYLLILLVSGVVLLFTKNKRVASLALHLQVFVAVLAIIFGVLAFNLIYIGFGVISLLSVKGKQQLLMVNKGK